MGEKPVFFVKSAKMEKLKKNGKRSYGTLGLLFTHNNRDFRAISVNEVGPRRSLFVFAQNTDALLTSYQQIVSTLASHIAEVEIVC